uniref:Uncharacterized protein n=1 Tax=Nelumbo nucifera TaxID=4432 RepID=A0A822YU39_NELNU|nr:TPA_asm: hypothetical protein HUJ06_006263 [Nelumbo nucifera]
MGRRGSISIPFVHANQSNYNAIVVQPPLISSACSVLLLECPNPIFHQGSPNQKV